MLVSHAASSASPEPSPSDAAPLLADASRVISSLDLPFESTQPLPASMPSGLVKTTGLHRAPLSGGVKTATVRYDLPTPPVGVRNLVEIAQFGHLCTTMGGMHHRRAGYPFGTLIDFAADGAGNPIFCLSPLAIHTRNLLEDPRCSLVVQMPGWTGLANARVSSFFPSRLNQTLHGLQLYLLRSRSSATRTSSPLTCRPLPATSS
jgi:hypothetical protein